MAEEAASQAQPEYYPEEQQQEEDAGIEAFREGGVVRMAEGGLPRDNPENPFPLREPRLSFPDTRGWFEIDPLRRLREFREGTSRMERARERGDIVVPPMPDYTVQGVEQQEPFAQYRRPLTEPPSPATQAGGEVVPPPEAQNELPVPPTPPRATAQPSAGSPRGSGMPSSAGGQAAQGTDPTIQALYDRLRATGQSREDYRREAVNTGLMQAGLAMMASQSPNALANIGQGGLRGLEAYTQEMRQGRQGERQGIQDEIMVRRAQTEEAYRRGIITNQERQLRLAELRMGEAAGDRSERRRERSEDRQRELDIRAEGNLRSTLPDITRRIAAINEQLTAIPQRRNPAQETEYQELVRARGELESYAGQIRQRLMTSAGIEANVPAPTQNAPGLPPGARSTPLFPR
jgi:hypothetical protein